MNQNSDENSKKLNLTTSLGLSSATLIVVANMIGSAIFAVTGEMAAETPSQFALLISWLVGGIMAICGALAYGELASIFPRSGGEYNYLSRIYHPSVGFVSGFVSLIAGFSAAIALNAFIFATYFSKINLGFISQINPTILAVGLVAGLTLLHATNVNYGVALQNAFTILKITLVVLFIIGGLFITPTTPVNFSLIPSSQDLDLIFSSTFATGMINVFYAYLGWNAAVYITGEVKDARKNVPRALMLGAGVVTILYLLINYVFLKGVPLDLLQGKIEIGTLAAESYFGKNVAQLLSGMIALALVSSTSSMVMAGPRVTQVMGEDYSLFKFLSIKKNGAPLFALGLQFAIAALLIFTSTFFEVLKFIGFTLSIFSSLTVAGVYIARAKGLHKSNTFVAKTLGYPITPLIFISLSLWMVINTIIEDKTHVVTLIGFGTLILGFLLYFLTKNLSPNKSEPK